MIKGHHSLILRKLFTSKKTKNSKIIPQEFLCNHRFSPTHCNKNGIDRKNCTCKRRRSDIDMTIKNKHESNLRQVQPLSNPK